MRVISIASGSSGNCTCVVTKEARILIDAGVSAKKIVEGLCGAGIDPDTLDAILITHEHSDHTAGLSVFLHKYRATVYGTHETLQAIISSNRGKPLPTEQFRSVTPGVILTVGEAEIASCYIPHDAAKPVAYGIRAEGQYFAMATDLGCYDDTIVKHLSGADAVLLESNYDRDMLLAGPYPYHLKRRILGAYGHLSNDDCGSLMVSVLHRELRHIILAHLSKENNYPELALASAQAVLRKNWRYTEPAPKITVAKRDVPTEEIVL